MDCFDHPLNKVRNVYLVYLCGEKHWKGHDEVTRSKTENCTVYVRQKAELITFLYKITKLYSLETEKRDSL